MPDRALIEAAKRQRGVNQRLPINPEMVEKGKLKLGLSTSTGSELWGETMLGFHFAFRLGEIDNLADRDIAFEKVGSKPRNAIRIRGSRTDQCKLGVHRTLVMTGGSSFTVQGIAKWLDMKAWRPLDSTKICPDKIETKGSRFLKNLATECGMDPNRVSTHSMRA